MFELGPRTYSGGGKFDIVTYATASTGIMVDLHTPGLTAGAAAGHRFLSIEGITGTAFDDVIVGNNNDNALVGGAGNDSLSGREGNDWITPGTGNDTVDGGLGTDMVSFANLARSVQVDLATGIARSGSDTTQLINIENITGSIFGDNITGNAGPNLIRALGDYDWIVGSGGGDTIDGGTGRDMVSYVNSPTPVTVDLGAARGLAGMAAGDVYISIESATGSRHADTFYGSPGEDIFRGMAGNDTFFGSANRDRYDGGTGFDTVSYALATAGVTASLLLGRGSTGMAARDLYTLIEALGGSNFADQLTGDNGANLLHGNGGNDWLWGNAGNDTLDGGDGDDTLDGGFGDDRIIGGAGRDTAVFAGSSAGYSITSTADHITVLDLNGGGTDRLFGIEVLQFADGTIFL